MKRAFFFMLLAVATGFVFPNEPVIYVNIYTIGSDPVVANIIRTELSTKDQLDEAITVINREFRDHRKYGETPLWEAKERIAADSDLFPGMSQYLWIISDFIPSNIKTNLLKTEDARNLSRRYEELQSYILNKLKRNNMFIFPVVVRGSTNKANEKLALRISSDGNIYDINETHLNHLLDKIKTDINRDIPVVLHIILDHSGSLQHTIKPVTKNLTNKLQEIWHYQVMRTASPLERFLYDNFIDIPGGYYEIGTKDGHPIERLHTVYLSKYKIMASPVMQKLYNLYLTENNLYNPAKYLNDNSHQTNISYYDACVFVEFLNKYFKTDGFHIATEEQLEVLYKTKPRGFQYGSILEITRSFYGDYDLTQIVDPTGPVYGTDMTVRGYPMESDPSIIRPATRGRIDPGTPSPLVGLRLAYRGGN